MGALMGGGVGLTIGFIFGSWSIIRYAFSSPFVALALTVPRHGAGPRGFMATLSQYMLSSAATFSFFLAIGSVIRTDVPQLQAIQMQLAAADPVVRSKYHGAQLMRARWEQERKRQATGN
ncbi:hypothetical protein CC1G_03754 [Coprinopsis cinerea okayama7|uniref:Uncharacterized protein n=1 Tax=Coprinopsis cinerea (strain Okayama-7 / 130 / ATCC MYA-4618 / FGSC 9003) TaxID=240176 RepID=A8N247_COPC7|nr:hypothetical protein CC1G_03754 [Coprinopsis cinerea okayama7\|eukprot:XP_001828960.2 hypothetical protein CC1G_03754 [Coprinopsis cinerea okayama7\